MTGVRFPVDAPWIVGRARTRHVKGVLLLTGPWTNLDWCWVTSFVELATTLATTFSNRIRFGNKSDTYWLPSWALNGASPGDQLRFRPKTVRQAIVAGKSGNFSARFGTFTR